MRNSERYGYSTVASIKSNKSKGGGNAVKNSKKGVWIEVKTSADTDMKATNPTIHLRVSSGVVGKKALKYASGY